ncbi:Hypothetical_protein [Hexamita inflata]|uniref:Hypothetical_protein n=1 Tax=Hexamita inflata TaxID=28002 RepID=A0AA86PNI8_9EUKA|nr:Hypothetical protein HINF_LOCUS25719 [Hexamita inflata]
MGNFDFDFKLQNITKNIFTQIEFIIWNQQLEVIKCGIFLIILKIISQINFKLQIAFVQTQTNTSHIQNSNTFITKIFGSKIIASDHRQAFAVQQWKAQKQRTSATQVQQHSITATNNDEYESISVIECLVGLLPESNMMSESNQQHGTCFSNQTRARIHQLANQSSQIYLRISWKPSASLKIVSRSIKYNIIFLIQQFANS